MNFDHLIDAMKDDMIKSVQDLVKIKSLETEPLPGAPFGKDMKDCLDKALEINSALGFATQNFDGYAGHAEYGQGQDIIGILVHVDVVPEGTGWTHDPYGGEVFDNKIFGRGTIDDKGPAVAAMYALKAVKEAGVEFKKRVRIIIGCDEETGRWKCMKHYFKHAEMPMCGFSPDADFPIINSEKGILIFHLNSKFNNSPTTGCEGISVNYLKGGSRPNMVPDYAECQLEMKNDLTDKIKKSLEYANEKLGRKITAEFSGRKCLLKSYGISAHGSTPEQGINAVAQLIAFVCSLPLCPSDQTTYLNFVNNHIGMEVDGHSLGLDMSDAVSGKLVFNLGVITLDEEAGSICINVRYPVTYTRDDVYDILKKQIQNTEIVLVEGDEKDPLYVPADNFMVKKLRTVYEEVTGTPSHLISIGGGTYARAIKNAVAFGPLFPGQPELAHQKDEYIGIDDLIKSTKIYAKAIYELVKE